MHRAFLSAAILAWLVALAPDSFAKPRRFGFQNFGSLQKGGYSIVSAQGTSAGPSTVRIHAAPNGRSANVAWKNTFYTEHGSYGVTMRWRFLGDGTLAASTIDPRVTGPSVTGSFTLNGSRAIPFAATAGGVTANGIIRKNGGGSVAITLTLKGLPEGDVTCSFSGGRVR